MLTSSCAEKGISHRPRPGTAATGGLAPIESEPSERALFGGEGSGGGGSVLDFELPVELEAGEPAEARGLARDEVRLLVARRTRDEIEHAQFRDIGRFLVPGD